MQISQKQKEVLKKLVKTFEENSIDYEVTGGLAAAFYGSTRPIYDLDIDIHQKDFPKAAKIFKEYIVEGPDRTTGDPNFDIYLTTLNIEGVHVDISQAEQSYFVDIEGKRHRLDSDMSNSKVFDLEGVKIKVCDKEGLITYKRIIGRSEDLEDIRQIS